MITTSTLFNNRYKLIRQIGEGGYGVVWLASDILNNTEVAIKIYRSSLPSDIVERARREYSLGMRFSHPNVLPTYDFNQDGKYPYIIMPYCSFGSIEKLAGNIPEWTIWRIIKDIASGLEHLHQHGIKHLDIKPANFLLDSQGNYVLSDFGLSHRLADLIHRYDKNITVGGAAYMSPERFAPNTKIDTYSDIWSLGVSIYELVTGELPFYGWGGQQQLFDRILSLQCDKCSRKLSDLIDACINPSPQNRPSATEIIVLADSVIINDSIVNGQCPKYCVNDAILPRDTVIVIKDMLNKYMTTKNAVKLFEKIIIVIICVFISLLLPLIIQIPLNRLFRDLYNPSGWIVLQPHLRIISTLVCFCITYGIGLCLLIFIKSRRWLFVFHAILTFLWCVFIAILLMP